MTEGSSQGTEGVHHAWHSRGYIPHYDEPGLFQLLTFRLHDSLPAQVVASLHDSRQDLTDVQRRTACEDYLDSCRGACHLRDSRIAELAQGTLLHFDGERYRLLAWVVMPNHLHVLAQFMAEHPLPKVVHSWKSYIANQANKLLGRSGQFWQREYFDRFIRNETHYLNAVQYVEWNPVKAGLAERPERWPFGSSGYRAPG
jgi:REP element-mobilizing transposase RayT